MGQRLVDTTETQRLIAMLPGMGYKLKSEFSNQRALYQRWYNHDTASWLLLEMYADGSFVWRRDSREVSVVVKALQREILLLERGSGSQLD